MHAAINVISKTSDKTANKSRYKATLIISKGKKVYNTPHVFCQIGGEKEGNLFFSDWLLLSTAGNVQAVPAKPLQLMCHGVSQEVLHEDNGEDCNGPQEAPRPLPLPQGGVRCNITIPM